MREINSDYKHSFYLNIVLSEHIPVKRPPIGVYGRFAPPTGVVAETTALGDGGIESRDPQVGIRGGRSVPLHGYQPGRRKFAFILKYRVELLPYDCNAQRDTITFLTGNSFQSSFTVVLVAGTEFELCEYFNTLDVKLRLKMFMKIFWFHD